MTDIPSGLHHEPRNPDLLHIYKKLNADIDKNPFDPQVWDSVFAQAKREEGTSVSLKGPFGKIPLDELSQIAKEVRDTEGLEGKFSVLTKPASTGELWYDLTLGRINELVLRWASENPIRYRHWKRGLDLGSGFGNSSRILQHHVDTLIGLDKNFWLQKIARNRDELHNTPMLVGDATALPFAGASFDLIASNGLTRYILGESNNRSLVKEIFRVLNVGGSYIEAFPTQTFIDAIDEKEGINGKSILVNLMERCITDKETRADLQPTSLKEQFTMFSSIGFAPQLLTGKDTPVMVIEFRKRSI